MYMLIKYVHVCAAAISIAGFALRGAWMLLDSPLRNTRVARTLPHALGLGTHLQPVLLDLQLDQYPFTHGWLTAKLIALVAYIGLGLVALRFGRSAGVRAAAFAGALVCAGYIVLVAVTRDPWLGLA